MPARVHHLFQPLQTRSVLLWCQNPRIQSTDGVTQSTFKKPTTLNINLHPGLNLSRDHSNHVHGCSIHVNLMEGAMPDYRGLVAGYRLDARATHRPMPKLVIAPNKQRLPYTLHIAERSHTFVKTIRICDRLHFTPRQLPTHGGDKFHWQEHGSHTWM